MQVSQLPFKLCGLPLTFNLSLTICTYKNGENGEIAFLSGFYLLLTVKCKIHKYISFTGIGGKSCCKLSAAF